MSLFKVGIIGCGGRGNGHAAGYAASSDAEIVACADPKRENAESLAKKYNVPKIYEDYKQMLAEEDLDIVSICVWTPLHKEIVIDAANNGVKGIHCEKPMAPTWGDAKALYQACSEASPTTRSGSYGSQGSPPPKACGSEASPTPKAYGVDNNVMITFCHQRRFGAPFVKAKQLANDGTIGQLHRMEGYCSNLIDWGTHWFDMMFFYNNDEPAEWVMGQIHCEKEGSVFGVPVENHGLSYIKWKNGIYGLLVTGGDTGGRCYNRLIGTDGIIELGAPNAPSPRVLRKGASDWEAPSLAGVVPPGDDTTLSVLDLIDCLKTGREPELSGRKALQATELIFATYESSRKRERIYLPLEIEDSPLISMIEAGMVGSEQKE